MQFIASITFKAFDEICYKEIIIFDQSHFFASIESIKNICTEDTLCNDFEFLSIDFKKVEVFQ